MKIQLLNKKTLNTRKKTYFQNLKEGLSTALAGLKLSFKHLWQARQKRKQMDISNPAYFEQKTGVFTVRYPKESIPMPDNGRNRLHNEIDDCIVCDKCAKICPVNCIDIEPIRATDKVGEAADGSPIRLYAAKFNIDMAKCFYCGLCTTVCPTDCLTMTNDFDYSETDVNEMNYHFATLSEEEATEKKQLLAQFLKEKEEAKKAKQAETQKPIPKTDHPKSKASFKPKTKTSESEIESTKKDLQSKPKFKPKAKSNKSEESSKPKFRPKIKPKSSENENEKKEENSKPKPKFRPKIKTKKENKDSNDNTNTEE